MCIDSDQKGNVSSLNEPGNEALVRIAPQARRESKVASLVILVVENVALAVLGQLTAQKLRGSSRVLVQLNRDACGGMAVTSGICIKACKRWWRRVQVWNVSIKLIVSFSCH